MTEPKKQTESKSGTKVRLVRKSAGYKLGDVIEVSKAEAERLVREHHAVKAD